MRPAPRTCDGVLPTLQAAAQELLVLRGNYYLTIIVVMALGGLAGTAIGALYGFAGHEQGWWGVGLLLGIIYGTLGGFALADRA